MRNNVISYGFREFEVFLKVPVIIIRFGENNVFWPIYINMYQFPGLEGGGINGSPCIYRLLFIKVEKLQEHDLSYNQILHIFLSNMFFSSVNNTKLTKRKAWGAPLNFFHEVSIVVLTDIIVMLLTPGLCSAV